MSGIYIIERVTILRTTITTKMFIVGLLVFTIYYSQAHQSYMFVSSAISLNWKVNYMIHLQTQNFTIQTTLLTVLLNQLLCRCLLSANNFTINRQSMHECSHYTQSISLLWKECSIIQFLLKLQLTRGPLSYSSEYMQSRVIIINQRL